jgi:putative MATE family efflux protein
MLDLRYKTILAVALPMMVSGFIQSIVLLTDASFIARYSTEAFDAVGNGGLLYVTMYMTLLGMGDGAQIIIARRIGEERSDAIGRIFGTSLLTHFLLAIILFAVLYWIMPGAVLGYSKNQEIASLQGDYVQIRSFALFFAMITISIQALFLAKGKTWVVLMASIITALSNVVLDYGMIFGKLGFPEMGLKGAAWASTIADGMGMLFLVIYLIFSEERRIYKLFEYFSFNFKSMIELLKVGSPLMLQGFSALATWTLFFTWLEQKGQFDLTVSQNIRSIYFLAFVPIWGFAGTTKTYISQYIGAKEFDKIPIIQRKIQVMTVLFLLVTFHGALFYPEAMIRMINPEEIYVQKSAEILRLITLSILVFGFSSVYFQTIHGSGNTLHSMTIEFTCVFIYSCSSYLFIKIWNLDVFWIWTVEYIYFTLLGVFSLLYLHFYDWKKKIV